MRIESAKHQAERERSPLCNPSEFSSKHPLKTTCRNVLRPSFSRARCISELKKWVNSRKIIWTIPKRHHARRGDPAPSGRATTCPRWRCHSAAFPGVAATAPGSSGTVLPAPCPGHLRHPYPARTRCPTWLVIPLVALGTFSRRSSKKTFMWLKNPPAAAQKSPAHGS